MRSAAVTESRFAQSTMVEGCLTVARASHDVRYDPSGYGGARRGLGGLRGVAEATRGRTVVLQLRPTERDAQSGVRRPPLPAAPERHVLSDGHAFLHRP
jgi:hypothetical protein